MKNRLVKALIYLILIVVSIIFLSPFYIMLTGSFKSYSEIFANIFGLPIEWTITNYVEVIPKINLGRSFLNSAIITFFSLAGLIVFSGMAAYRITRVKTKFHRVIYFLFVASMVIPFPTIMLSLVRIMSAIKLYNTRIAVIFAYFGFGEAFACVLFCGYLKTIPVAMEEAAQIDGASQLQVFFLVVMPMLKPTVATLIVLDIIWVWNDYLLPAILMTRGHLRTIPLSISYLFDQFNSRWDLAMSAVMLCIVPVIIVFVAFQKYIIAGVAAGSVKG